MPFGLHKRSFTEEDTPPIPYQPINKKIHYIWVGGALPTKYYRAMLEIAAHAPNYQVYLWTDHPNVLNKASAELGLDRPLRNIHIRQMHELFNLMKIHCTKLAFSRLEEIFLCEGIGFKNFAAKSDVMRLLILYFEGGIYLDTDTIYKTPPASESKKESKEESGRFPELKLSHGFACTVHANDIMVSAPRHPILHDMINQIISNYKYFNLSSVVYNKKGYLETAIDGKRRPNSSLYKYTNFRLVSTIRISGPNAVKESINKYFESKPCDQQGINITRKDLIAYPNFKTLHQLSQLLESHSDMTWLKTSKTYHAFDTQELDGVRDKHTPHKKLGK